MKTLGMLLFLSLACLACSVKPEPIAFGKASCHHCKMTLMDPKFGAEIVTSKGKVHTFDDINCMVNFMKEKALPQEEISYLMVVDMAKTKELIAAQQAFFVKGSSVNTPMGSGVVAFAKVEPYEAFIKEKGGELLTWKQVLDLF
ncbi:nitrous oxide reductase accessory protein NosL [Cytophagales bacterium LB-30]|uniref:Nitrous oxide reductase accessory protein NosL n=1 Tax=Shiella aurantiaca TaxID=3058365 RepID=A0ABT8F3Z0_9BACT|nr:nitrous oxide reductase accessory protein NosL [Shiella aurantiaca]MDN4165018.1 nitrous oxide reductase accessory protein NosL [Shiella aurantiaca]